MVHTGRLIIVSLGILFTSLCLYVWPVMGGATILGALSGIILELIALSMKWRRTAIWAGVSAVTLLANLAFLMSGTESGTTMLIGLFLPAIVALALIVSYIVERGRRRHLPGAS